MANVTDPAREMVELCERIGYSSHDRGDVLLANTFGVGAWTIEFHLIIASIVERIDYLKSLVVSLDMDDDIRVTSVGYISALQSGFDGEAMLNGWHQRGAKALSPTHIAGIRPLSPLIRAKVSFPKLTAEEVQEVLTLTAELEGWLSEHQLHEQDFIRQAIIEGLKQFRFRLTHLDWLGWGYALRSLREVIGAYLAMERGINAKGSEPNCAAMLKKVRGYLIKASKAMGAAREAKDNAAFALEFYKVASHLVTGGAGAGIAGLLT